MNKKIKISVIVPVYNEERYLDECVTSICNQTYENLEIILVDDGSALSCYKMCDTYMKKDNRIRVIHKENGGSLSARRKGIEEATGDYVAFVDSDDWIELDLYNKMIDMIATYEPDMIGSSNYYRNYTDGNFINTFDNKRTGFWKDHEFEEKVFPYFIKDEDFFDTEFPLAMWAYLFKTDFAYKIINKIEDKIKTSEDYVFTMLAFLNATSFAAISYRGYHYRNNISSKTHILKNTPELLFPVYESVNKAIMESSYYIENKEILKKKNRIVLYHEFMLREYELLVKSESTFLFPYSNVTRGSRILIYGAGKLGKQIYYTLKGMEGYEIVAIADKNWKSYRNQGFDVIAPEHILSQSYDYIIIAITYINIKRHVKNELMHLGVPADKFAEVDLDVMDEANLPF